MDKYETLRNQVVWAVTHYGIVNTEGIIKRLRDTVLELDSKQLQDTTSNSGYAKCIEDLYENYPCKDEWDRSDIAELLKKHFA
jgi:hypothetical protein